MPKHFSVLNFGPVGEMDATICGKHFVTFMGIVLMYSAH